jgi:formamidopyrimidine-DNA glycosylase
MPELPEVEVIRLFLEAKLAGKNIKHLEILWPKSFIGDANNVIGQKISKFTRIGKQLSIHLENNLILLVHLKMTGQLIFIHHSKTILGHPTPNLNDSQLPNKSTRIIFTFSDNSKLYFNDQRKFGWIKVFNKQDEIKEFQKNLGFDVLDPRFTSDYFYSQLQRSARPIKLALLDQSKFAGIGNIYANDALFIAQINPRISSNKLTKTQADALRLALIEIIKESIKHGGSTAKDNKYVHPDGSFGQQQYYFRVYQREGEPCLVCGAPIIRSKIGGRGTFYCPVCQK